MSTVLVVGADSVLVADALAGLGDEDLVVLDESAASLERLEEEVGDPRVWFMIGGGDVIPLPDRSVDAVVGAPSSPEIDRVSR